MAKTDKKDETKPKNAKQYLAELGFALNLIESDPSLQKWIVDVRNYMKKNDNRVPTPYELDGLKQGIDWFDRYNSDQELARMAQNDPRRKADFDRSLELKKESIRAIARQTGVELDEGFLSGLALDSRLDNLTQEEIKQRLAPIVEQTILEGGDLGGDSAEFERTIVQWADRNGLALSGNTIAKYVAAGTSGASSIDDIKNDLRKTYLSGSYPAWSDRIMMGEDPADIAAPYKARMSRLLEVDETDIDLNDQLLQKAMQGVGADGKPSVVPLYSFDQQVREDERWQYTDNAMDVYANAGNNILKMFGLR
jgi:hypothetical protein